MSLREKLFHNVSVANNLIDRFGSIVPLESEMDHPTVFRFWRWKDAKEEEKNYSKNVLWCLCLGRIFVCFTMEDFLKSKIQIIIFHRERRREVIWQMRKVCTQNSRYRLISFPNWLLMHDDTTLPVVNFALLIFRSHFRSQFRRGREKSYQSINRGISRIIYSLIITITDRSI